jgi:plastocyanin
MFRSILSVLALTVLAACGGGGAAPVTGGPDGTPALASFSITHPQGAVQVGDTMVMTVQARDGDGQPVTSVAPRFTSSDATVATVDAGGVVRGLKAGAATIEGSLTVGGITKTASFAIAILPSTTNPPPPPAQPVAAFALNPATVTLAPGASVQFETVATDAAGARVTALPQIGWALQDPTRATISAGVVTATAAGSTTVTASFTSGGRTWSATATVNVTQGSASTAAVRGIEDRFSPSSVTIGAGGTVTWTMEDEEHDVTWTGAAPAGGNIGKMDRGESVSRTFAEPGTYAYTCSRHDGKHGGTVIVEGAQQAVFTSVRISPAGPVVGVGGTLQLTATPLDQLGRAMTGLPAAQWSSANTAIATVSATGAATGVAAGTAAVTARITQNGTTREATANVTVGTTTTPAPGAPLAATVTTPGESFSPATVTIGAGGTVTWQFIGSTRHNVTFSGAAPTGGNVPDSNAGTSAQRTFPTAGTYSYQCTRHSGMTGTVVVQP